MTRKALLTLVLLKLTIGPSAFADNVISDDLIVNGGSACVGIDCVNGESFGFDTLRLKENNLRIHFDDTSNSASFPNNDWRIIINDSNNGADAYFGIQDVGVDGSLDRIPFRIQAGAPQHTLVASSSGRIGIRNQNPVTDVHMISGNTPTVRLDQDGSSGFTPQIWDVAGNEAGFFIRDATNGSSLVFRIRPSAPANSIYIDTDGSVGIGAVPSLGHMHMKKAGTRLMIEDTNGTEQNRTQLLLRNRGGSYIDFTNSSDNERWLFGTDAPNSNFFLENVSGGDSLRLYEDGRFQVRPGGSTKLDFLANGNLNITGMLSQGSSRETKENITEVDVEGILGKLRDLPIMSWQYKSDPPSTRHIGPMAEDFYSTFNLGQSDKTLAPSDVAGVALLAVKSLLEELEGKTTRLSQLKKRIERLEAREREFEVLESRLAHLESLLSPQAHRASHR